MRIAAAIAAFRALKAATRAESGNLAYDVLRGTEQDALDAHRRSAPFLRYGRDTLERYAPTHESVTCRPLGAS